MESVVLPEGFGVSRHQSPAAPTSPNVVSSQSLDEQIDVLAWSTDCVSVGSIDADGLDATVVDTAPAAAPKARLPKAKVFIQRPQQPHVEDADSSVTSDEGDGDVADVRRLPDFLNSGPVHLVRISTRGDPFESAEKFGEVIPEEDPPRQYEFHDDFTSIAGSEASFAFRAPRRASRASFLPEQRIFIVKGRSRRATQGDSPPFSWNGLFHLSPPVLGVPTHAPAEAKFALGAEGKRQSLPAGSQQPKPPRTRNRSLPTSFWPRSRWCDGSESRAKNVQTVPKAKESKQEDEYDGANDSPYFSVATTSEFPLPDEEEEQPALGRRNSILRRRKKCDSSNDRGTGIMSATTIGSLAGMFARRHLRRRRDK